MQDSNPQNSMQAAPTTPSPAPAPNPEPMPGPTPMPQATDNTYPPVATQAPIANEPAKKPSPIPKIIIAVVLVIILAVGGFFLITHLIKGPKTIAEFEKIMTDLGYKEGQGYLSGYGDTNGAYSIYAMSNQEEMVESTVLFYNMSSREKLKDLIESQGGLSGLGTDEDLDWSKKYDKKEGCQKTYGDLALCHSVVQYDNTLLAIIIVSKTEDKSTSEIKKVLSAMGY